MLVVFAVLQIVWAVSFHRPYIVQGSQRVILEPRSDELQTKQGSSVVLWSGTYSDGHVPAPRTSVVLCLVQMLR
jgi:hypothetical protein